MSEITKETLEQWRKLTIRPESTGLDCLRLMNIKDALINALESLQQENRELTETLRRYAGVRDSFGHYNALTEQLGYLPPAPKEDV